MKSENDFLAQNREKWIELERLLDKKKKKFEDFEQIGRLYQEATEDLSYAQTHFPGSRIEEFLNSLVRKCHLLFQTRKKPRIKGAIDFLAKGFAKMLTDLRIPIAVSGLIFVVSIATSFIMVTNNVELAQMFLDQSSYEMALRDLENRREFGNFDDIPEEVRIPLSVHLWIHNSRVSLLVFVLGITFGIGTLYILIVNGFMLGSLMAVYFMNGHFLDFFSLIMVHGSVELTAIAIAGGAGFSLAGAILNPARQTRIDRIKFVAKRALKCFIGVVIMLLWAGLLEGLITPLKLPIWIRLLIAVVNILIISLYFASGTAKSQPEEIKPTNTSLLPSA